MTACLLCPADSDRVHRVIEMRMELVQKTFLLIHPLHSLLGTLEIPKLLKLPQLVLFSCHSLTSESVTATELSVEVWHSRHDGTDD